MKNITILAFVLLLMIPYTVFANTSPKLLVVNAVSDVDTIVSGKTDKGNTVKIQLNKTVLGSGKASSNGKFSIKIKSQKARSILTVITINKNKKSISKKITVKSTPVPKLLVVNAVSDVDTIVSGKTDKGNTVKIQLNKTVLGLGKASSNGKFSIKIKSQKARSILTVITINKNKKSISKKITVKSTPVEVVQLQNNKVTVKINSKVQLGASITPINATNKTLKWVSNNENIATVDVFGNVTGVSNGVAEIKVSAQNGIYTTCTVTVEDNIEIPSSSIFYDAIKINEKMYGYNYFTGESRIFPYLTEFKEISINGEKELFVPSVIDVRQYSEDTFGTQSGLFNLLQILVGSYTIVPSQNPFLEGNIQLMYSSGNWGTTNKDLTSSSLKLGYEKKYESLNNVSIDQWYEYNGKQFRNPVISFEQNVPPYRTSAKYFEQNGIRFVQSGSWTNELYVSINDLLQYLEIDKSISYGKQGDSIYVEIK